MKKIAIINQDSGYLMIDLANAFVERGFDVLLITGRLATRSTPLNEKVQLYRIKEYNRETTLSRLWSWLRAFIQIWWIIASKHRNAHLWIVSNPPLNSFLPFSLPNNYSFWIFDIYPDILWNEGFIKKNNPLSKLWILANKVVFRKAKHVFTLTQEMKDVLSFYTSANKINILPIWTDNVVLKPIPKSENPFIEKHGLKDKFIVLYSGNLGLSHHLEVIPQIASLIHNPDILFLIIGHGKAWNVLESMIKDKNLVNCLMLPRVPSEELPFSLASADLALVSTGSGAANLSIPSKTFNYMSVGAPLLSLSPKNSALSNLVTNHKIGKNFNHDDLTGIAGFIEKMYLKEADYLEYSTNSLQLSYSFSFNSQFIEKYGYV